MKKSKILNLLSIILKYPFFMLSFLVPKSSKIWVMGAWYGERYSDNSKYLFEHIVMNEDNIIPIWLTHNQEVLMELRSRGQRVYLINSILGYWYSCRASVAIFSSGLVDVNPLGLYRAKKVQLWHGIPLKKIGYDDKFSYPRGKQKNLVGHIKSIVFPYTNEKWDAMISTSPLVSKYFHSAFNIAEDNIYVTGYPRNDILFEKNVPEIKMISELREKYKCNKIIGYVPTFRNGQFNLLKNEDREKLEQFLEKENCILLVKLHFIDMVRNNFKVNNFNSRLIFLGEEVSDVNILLPHLDILLTDYSSVYFDYLLLDRPIVFTPFDLQEYKNSSRELYEDYEDVTPGSKCANWKEVEDVLSELINGHDNYKLERSLVRAKHFSYVDNKNSMRVVNIINNLKNKGLRGEKK
ncbi:MULTISPECIES: CDP-glycerol glycerophosphotransferase family protein [Bacillus]|uniref:CDP-glycerol glycerophosphotransferase family protein n=1 Tax=Bacillus TaxID=1386 RepID=UPI000E2EF6AE|nr:hypothetical protein DZB83_21380 [Bacillus sp. dmp10]